MKKKILVIIFIIMSFYLFSFIHFVISDGAALSDPPSLSEKVLDAFKYPYWINPSYTLIAIISTRISIFVTIIFVVVIYYLYDTFIKNRKNASPVSDGEQPGIIQNQSEIYNNDSKIEFFDIKTQQTKSRDRLFKKVVLWITPVIVIYIIFVISISSGPGEGMVGLVFLLPIMPVIYIFYPVYFIILSVRYSRERRNMDPLDKIMFYILAIPILSLGVFSVYKVVSGNVIQNLLADHQKSVEKKMAEKQKGPADLVVKDFSFSLGGAGIRFCNESTNATGEKVAIKIETDKGFSDIIENYPSLQPGDCEGAQIVNENYLSSTLKLKKGESVGITVTLDPKNKIIETNEENNTLTKKFDL